MPHYPALILKVVFMHYHTITASYCQQHSSYGIYQVPVWTSPVGKGSLVTFRLTRIEKKCLYRVWGASIIIMIWTFGCYTFHFKMQWPLTFPIMGWIKSRCMAGSTDLNRIWYHFVFVMSVLNHTWWLRKNKLGVLCSIRLSKWTGLERVQQTVSDEGGNRCLSNKQAQWHSFFRTCSENTMGNVETPKVG